MEKQTKPLRPIDRIKERLRVYTALLKEIDNQQARLERMTASAYEPSGPNLTGMPKAKGGISNPTANAAERQIELEDDIREKQAEEKAERAAIESMIRRMENPDERVVLRMNYFDRAEWPDICFALFGGKVDYIERMDYYQNRTYKIHGRALLNLADVMDAETT